MPNIYKTTEELERSVGPITKGIGSGLNSIVTAGGKEFRITEQGYEEIVQPTQNLNLTQSSSLATLPSSAQPQPQPTPVYSRLEPTIINQPPAPDYEKIREQERQRLMEQAQQRIAAIENAYRERIRREEELGARDVARARSIQAIMGMTGGETTGQAAAERRTQERIDYQNALKQQEIMAVFDRIDENARREAELKYQIALKEHEEIKEKIQKAALNNLLSLAPLGVDWKVIEQDPEFKEELNRTGKNAFEVYVVYNQMKPQPNKFETAWKDNNLAVIEYDQNNRPAHIYTFSAEDLGIPKGIEIQTTTLGNQVYWWDKNKPPIGNNAPRLLLSGKKGTVFYDEEGNEISAFDAARLIIKANPNASENELVNAIRENIVDDKGKPLIDISDAQRLAREMIAKRPPLTKEEIKKKIVDTLTPLKDQISRSEAKTAAETQLKSALKLKENQSLPASYQNAIEDALVEVYGRTFWQKLIPWGR